MQGDFNKVGVEGAVCVKCAEGNFGVVLPMNTGIVCTTCKYGKSSCDHVQKVLSIIDSSDEDDIPHLLLPFVLAKNGTPQKHMKNPPSCISRKKISFQISLSLAVVMQQPLKQRLNIQDSLCHLKESSIHTECPKCGCCNWRDVPSHKQSIIIMPRITHQSLGRLYFHGLSHICLLLLIFIIVYSKHYNTPECEGQLDFDGCDLGLLNMKSYLVAHEVLQDHMYRKVHTFCVYI